MLLAGDVGGTKVNLAIFSAGGGLRSPVAEATFASGKYDSLEDLVRDFMGQVGVEIEQAVFGVAGPVMGGRAHVTNLSWVIEEERLQDALNLNAVRLINDLVAVAYSVPVLSAGDLVTLNEGQHEEKGVMAVIAPGTGLGEGFLAWEGSGYRAYPSEGGHTDFAPTTPVQREMLAYLQERLDRVSYERVCSGLGMPNIYAFLKDSGRAEEPDWLAERMQGVDDITPVIASAALDEAQPCEICRMTLDIFVSILGAEAGNLALTVLSTGGVYLGGGIPPRILPVLKSGRFMDAFLSKGRLVHVMEKMSVFVIVNAKAALLGAASYGMSF